MSVKLDIACGANKPEGWVGIDIAKTEAADIVHDLFRFPWPIVSESVSAARCSHFVEHIPHLEAPCVRTDTSLDGLPFLFAPRRWVASLKKWGHVRDVWFDFWEEVHRILVPDGTIHIICPHYSSRRADQDPTHTRRICEESFLYLSQGWLEQNLVCYPFGADFIVESSTLVQYSADGSAREGNPLRDLNVVDDISVVMRAKKPGGCWWKSSSSLRVGGDGESGEGSPDSPEPLWIRTTEKSEA